MKKHICIWSNFFTSFILLLLIIGCDTVSSLPLTAVATSLPLERHPEINRTEPNPWLKPEEVVQIQLEALQTNDDYDSGIELTFQFASPANKEVTGPLSEFTQMMKDEYGAMLNFQSVEYEAIQVSGNAAVQRVTLVDAKGKIQTYIFSLSRQTNPPCMGCWMTDGVIRQPLKRKNNQI